MVAVACVTGVGFATWKSSRPLLFDASADRFLSQRSELWHRVAQRLSEVGDPQVFVTITVVVALALILAGDYRAAVAAVASVGLALVLVEAVLKPFFDRRLPDLVGPTFPSGHSTVAVALAGAVALAAGPSRPLGRLLGHFWRRLLVAMVLTVAASIGVAMVVQSSHYLTDVVTGVALGLSIAGCTAILVDVVAARGCAPKHVEQPKRRLVATVDGRPSR
jgi:membrane-associated phospholipid phosphatase